MSDYPDYLAERDYYDSIIGRRWEYGDNDPSDPENNWEEENE